jgi:hypothetical protein
LSSRPAAPMLERMFSALQRRRKDPAHRPAPTCTRREETRVGRSPVSSGQKIAGHVAAGGVQRVAPRAVAAFAFHNLGHHGRGTHEKRESHERRARPVACAGLGNFRMGRDPCRIDAPCGRGTGAFAGRSTRWTTLSSATRRSNRALRCCAAGDERCHARGSGADASTVPAQAARLTQILDRLYEAPCISVHLGGCGLSGDKHGSAFGTDQFGPDAVPVVGARVPTPKASSRLPLNIHRDQDSLVARHSLAPPLVHGRWAHTQETCNGSCPSEQIDEFRSGRHSAHVRHTEHLSQGTPDALRLRIA